MLNLNLHLKISKHNPEVVAFVVYFLTSNITNSF